MPSVKCEEEPGHYFNTQPLSTQPAFQVESSINHLSILLALVLLPTVAKHHVHPMLLFLFFFFLKGRFLTI